MTAQANSARTIFLDAVVYLEAEARRRYIDCACGEDAVLRQEVERLVAAHLGAEGFMERPAAALITADASYCVEQVGTSVGRYKLLEQLGEGGMGVVYVAEQTEPVRRRVALKIIKPGMDTRQVIVRFEAERQALALMDHPHIAKVLDAGETAAGRPYFVMELVRGLPITEYCDEAKASPRKRLELFVDVCQAVQHAHQKGIIHRDLKPSNVLVTLNDGKPIVKVIDFGVAKAVGQRLTERTVHTSFTELIGTPLYMSPEQAELSALDVDTRSDIYSLGVLLYELLTGKTPFDRDRIARAGLDEIRRVIREDEPLRPSHRLSTLNAEAITTIAGRRGLDVRQLGRTLQGELDWIVMKALEKDRDRRYETAAAFADDVARYLTDQPVQAGPPSALYRLKKFARRQLVAIVTVATVSAAIIVGAGVSVWQALEANAARDLANHRATQETEARRRAELNLRRGNEAVEILISRVEKLPEQPNLEDLQLSLITDAMQINRRFLADNADNPQAQLEAAKASRRLGEIVGLLWNSPDESTKASWEAVRTLEPLTGTFPQDRRYRDELARSYDVFFLGIAQWQLGSPDKAMEWYQRTTGPDRESKTRSQESRRLRALGDELLATSGASLWEKNLQHRRTTLGPSHPDTVRASMILALKYLTMRRTTDAIPLLETASTADPTDTRLMHTLAALQVWFGNEDAWYATCQRAIAYGHKSDQRATAERTAKACSLRPTADPQQSQYALELARRAAEFNHEFGLMTLGMAEYRCGHYQESEQACTAAAAAAEVATIPCVLSTAAFYRAMSLFRMGKKSEARQRFCDTAATMIPLPADDKNPLLYGSRDLLTLWLAFKEARDLIGFEVNSPIPRTSAR